MFKSYVIRVLLLTRRYYSSAMNCPEPDSLEELMGHEGELTQTGLVEVTAPRSQSYCGLLKCVICLHGFNQLSDNSLP